MLIKDFCRWLNQAREPLGAIIAINKCDLDSTFEYEKNRDQLLKAIDTIQSFLNLDHTKNLIKASQESKFTEDIFEVPYYNSSIYNFKVWERYFLLAVEESVNGIYHNLYIYTVQYCAE